MINDMLYFFLSKGEKMEQYSQMIKYCRYESRLGACPLLKQPDSYIADTVDLTRDDEARDYWLACFEDSLPKVQCASLISN